MLLGSNILASNLLASARKKAANLVFPFDDYEVKPCEVDAPVDDTNVIPVTLVQAVMTAALVMTASCTPAVYCPAPSAPVASPYFIAEVIDGVANFIYSGAQVTRPVEAGRTYRLWRSEGLTGAAVLIVESATDQGSDYIDVSAAEGTSYYYWLEVLYDDPCSWQTSQKSLFYYTCAPVSVITASVDHSTLDYAVRDHVTLTWSMQNSTAQFLNGAPIAASGSLNVSPAATTDYTFNAVGPCGTVQSVVHVVVTCPTPDAPDLTPGNTVMDITFTIPLGIPYRVYRVGIPEVLVCSGVGTEAAINCQDTGLGAGDTIGYYVQVDYLGSCGTKNSATTTATVLGCDLPIVALSGSPSPVRADLGQHTLALTVVSENIGAGTLSVGVYAMYSDHSDILRTLSPTVDTTSVTSVDVPTGAVRMYFAYTATTACGTVSGGLYVDVINEVTPTVNISVSTSPACPGVAYLDWTISNARSGHVFITGPMFGDGVTPTIVNANGETSGHMLITTQRGDKVGAQPDLTYTATWTITATFSTDAVAATDTATLCLKPIINSFLLNGATSVNFPSCVANSGTFTVNAYNCEAVEIYDQADELVDTITLDVNGNGSLTMNFNTTDTYTVHAVETDCGAGCNTRSVSCSLPKQACIHTPDRIKLVLPVPFDFSQCEHKIPSVDTPFDYFMYKNEVLFPASEWRCGWASAAKSIDGYKLYWEPRLGYMWGDPYYYYVLFFYLDIGIPSYLWRGTKDDGCGPCGRYIHWGGYEGCSSVPAYIDVVEA